MGDAHSTSKEFAQHTRFGVDCAGLEIGFPIGTHDLDLLIMFISLHGLIRDSPAKSPLILNY